MFHKALVAALLCGAVGFAIPSFAADYSSSTAATSSGKGTTTAPSSTAATSTDKGTTPTAPAATSSEKNSANATDTTTPAKPAKRVVRARTPAVDEEHSIIEALNQKSLEGAQSGATPDYASAEPASHQQAEAARASKTVKRTNTKASAKKGAG
jgi:hypothetical protein